MRLIELIRSLKPIGGSVFKITLLFLGVLAIVFPGASGLAAGDQRYVSVYADGENRGSITDATTVGEALEDFEIELNEGDVVEPSRDVPLKLTSFRINVYRARPVKVVDGQVEKTVLSARYNPRLIAKEAGFTVYDEDRFNTSTVTDFVGENFAGEKITIDRATPVTINFDNHQMKVRTRNIDVGDVLEENGIKLGTDDFVKPSVNTTLKPNMNIQVVRVGHEVATVEKTIKHDVVQIKDYNMPLGYSEVQQQGSDGVQVISYEVVRHNGTVSKRTQINKVMQKPVKNKIVRVGGSNAVYCATQGNTKQVDAANAALGRKLMLAHGWGDGEWPALLELWACESSWKEGVANTAGSGAYGIPQALPASKMASHGADYMSNPRTQIRWGLDYIASRYGSPSVALSFHHANNWY